MRLGDERGAQPARNDPLRDGSPNEIEASAREALSLVTEARSSTGALPSLGWARSGTCTCSQSGPKASLALFDRELDPIDRRRIFGDVVERVHGDRRRTVGRTR